MEGQPIPCPFGLTVEPMAAMLNFEIAGDPVYTGLEIQRFDDPVHGAGVAVLLMRRSDSRVDVYRQPGLRLDRASYGIGSGLGRWIEAELEPAVLEVTPTGALAEVRLRDADGRRVVVQVDDRDRRRRRPAALLAPVSAAVEHPTCLLLVWMPRFDLVRTGGRGVAITIDGRAVTTGRLPMARLHGRRLIKYAADLAVVRLNQSQDGPVPVVDPASTALVALAPGDGGAGIAALTATTLRHSARFVLDPPVPDLAGLADGASASGTWRVGIDDTPSVVSGTWHVLRSVERVELIVDSTARWRPGPLPLLMRVVTWVVPTFRRWPATYRWRATVTLGDPPAMTSAWERKGSAVDASYRRVMRS